MAATSDQRNAHIARTALGLPASPAVQIALVQDRQIWAAGFSPSLRKAPGAGHALEFMLAVVREVETKAHQERRDGL